MDKTRYGSRCLYRFYGPLQMKSTTTKVDQEQGEIKERVSVFTLQPSKDYKDREVILVSYESIHYSVEWQHIMETLVFTKDPHKWCKRWLVGHWGPGNCSQAQAAKRKNQHDLNCILEMADSTVLWSWKKKAPRVTTILAHIVLEKAWCCSSCHFAGKWFEKPLWYTGCGK